MEKRKKFYSDEIDIDRAEKFLKKLVSNCTLSEVLWIVRNITYDQVSYYDKDLKGVIYNGNYNDNQIEQATSFQRKLSTMCDLFRQVVVDKREFDNNYLDKLDSSVLYLSTIDKLVAKNDELKEEIASLLVELEDEHKKNDSTQS